MTVWVFETGAVVCACAVDGSVTELVTVVFGSDFAVEVVLSVVICLGADDVVLSGMVVDSGAAPITEADVSAKRTVVSVGAEYTGFSRTVTDSGSVSVIKAVVSDKKSVFSAAFSFSAETSETEFIAASVLSVTAVSTQDFSLHMMLLKTAEQESVLLSGYSLLFS